MRRDPKFGDLVDIPWGLATVRGRVIEVYGPALRRHVVVELTPELEPDLFVDPTTVSLPRDAVEPAAHVA